MSRPPAALLLLIALAVALTVSSPAGAAKPRAGADLSVTRLGHPPAQIGAGAPLRMSFVVRNAGSRRARATTIGFSLSLNARRDAADVPLGTAKVAALRGRRSSRGTAKLRVPDYVPGGTYRVLACADLSGKVRELGERNNCRAARARVAVTGRPGGPSGPPVRPEPGTGELPPPPTGPGTDPGQPGGPDPIPPDPAAIAPALPKTIAVSTFDAASFLWSAANPVQRGVAPGTIERDQVLVLRGRVLDRAGAPIEGVRVTVLDHPELGRTQTRADGRYDLAVNGTGLTLEFEAAGFLTAQRAIDPAWETYDRIEDVVMVPVDGAVTRIDKDSGEPFQVALGTPTTDADGTRRALLLFPKDVTATMTLPDGSDQELGDMNVRITEFTAGDQGVEAMPGSLPGTSGYTYAAEFSVDEALEARATQVGFDKPVINYVQNFIDAPVGSDVPTGAYDRENAEWEPGNDGRVIKIASESDGKAVLEGADGLGIGDDELRVLADRYEPGQQLWRVPMRHFTPWDHNWPYGPPRGSQPPKLKEFVWQDPNDPCRAKGSIIGCETGTLGESLPITGTPYSLSYSSDRQPGWSVDDALDVPITPATLPDRLKGIELKVTVAGRDIIQRWCDPDYPTTGTRTCAGMPNIEPNITHRVTWDGLDAYGRRPQGRQTVTIRLIYVYEFQYYASEDQFNQSFASFPSDLEVFDGRYSCGSISRSIEAHFFCGVPIGQTVTRSIGSWDAAAADGLGGWSLSGHHTYDPGNGVVHLGDGTDRSAQAIGAMTRTIVGGSGPGIGTPEAEGQPVSKVSISSNITGNTRAPDGTTYFAVWGREHGIFRVGADGNVRRYAGKRSTATDPLAKRLEEEGPPTGDGGPATDAVLGGDPIAMSVGPDGSLYFVVTPGASYPRGLIRKIAPGGTISTVAGSLDTSVAYQDGVPGRQTAVTDPQAVLAASDGSLYWTERPQTTNSMKGRLRRLSASGLVETVAGGGTDNLPADDQDLGDGEPARDNDFGGVPYGLAMGPDGSIYFALPSEHIVERVAPDGRIRRLAGDRKDPVGPPVYGEPAVASSIGNPTGVAIGPNGEVYIRHDEPGSPSFVFISRVRTDGVLEHLAGLPRGFCGGQSQNGEQATRTCIEGQGRGLMVDPDGTVVYQDGTGQIRRIEPALPGFGSQSSAVPSEDASEVWEFDAAGRHLRTVDGITGAKLQRFTYDGAGRLTGIEDRDGNTTTIERAADGTPQAIVAPGGQRTTLELDSAGRVAAVRDPAGRATTMTYHDGSLLATLRRPEGGTSTLTYDARGRLTKDVDADGVVTTLDRTQADGKTTVDVSVGGRVTSYEVQTLSNGDRVRTIRRPGGAETKLVIRPDSTRVRTDPDGTTTTVEPAADPRWGNLVAVPGKETVKTPAGKERVRTWDRTAFLTDPLDRFSVTSMSVAVTENPGGRTEWSYSAGLPSNPDDQTMTVRSPEGRMTTTTLDRLTRPTKIVPATGVTPIVFAYDARGRVTGATQGSSATALAWDDQNRLVQRSDGEGGTLGYAYDAADRLTQVRVPGGTYGIAYAADGSRTITTPAGRTFAIGVTPAGRERSFRPAGQAGAHVRSYGPARELVETALPSGAKRALGYDGAGRLAADNDPEAQRTYGYDGVADVFATLGWQRPGGGGSQSLSFGHDGLLPTSEASSGAADGTVTTTWGAGFLPTQQVIDAAGGTVTTPMGFDRDRMLKQLGAFAIERAGPGGAQSAVRYAGDGMSVTTMRDALARLGAKRLAVGGAERFGETLGYDNAGRVRSTAMAGATRFYEYDQRGQLRRVHTGSATGQVVEEYSYDADGNRTGAAYAGEPAEAATYGPESGRLTKRAGLDYAFDADGFLTKRGQDTFAYSRGGELLSATVGGKSVTYDYDALGRRTARHEGAATERYLHGDPTNPLLITAWVDAGGTLNVPRYDGDGTLFAIDRGGSRVYVATDHLGSPRLITDAAGATLRTIEYDAFGRVTGGTGSFDLPIGYAGGLSDPVTGLVRFGKRDYEPASGRWTAEDPTFFAGSPGNLYAYVGSNPTTLTDPTGLVCVGFSAYEGVGGGIQLCRDNSIDNASWSLCGEIGVGLGGGLDVDLAGGAQETGGAIVAEATWRAGWAGGTLGGELDLDCLNFKSSGKIQYGPAAVGLDSSGGVSVGYSSPENHIGGQAQGKIAYKRCAKF